MKIIMKKALVIGASSGIGKELALLLAKKGVQVGLMARRIELLQELQIRIGPQSHAGPLDMAAAPEAIDRMMKMIEKMGGADLIILNAGIGFINPGLEWSKERQTIDVNVYGFTALAGAAYNYFSKTGLWTSGRHLFDRRIERQ